ncbi:phosphatidylinositol mannoside acyltransferase [Corynebacterium alimapuense]|uniref:Phosphatidylinositol mannoside acyltransferase n=1 Tax=Corynebacterium alimapuense TaxID=1576874 RepID=A0A3M8K7S7_9CORY|nr:phosphatidylinositol mannoside acyltransferase [Corynebacterium alimapuense]RNE49273.1 phosphatidylinositol mannoside acyltransferase [Corynebacterium alimapuense]
MNITRSDLSALGYLAGWKLVRWLPESVARALFNAGADLASDHGRGMEQLRCNLTRVVGAENVTAELVRDSVRSYARYWLEAFRLPSLKDDPELATELAESVIGTEHLDKSRAAGRGVILTLPHSGNWDMAGLFLVAHHGQFATVAERVRPEALFEAFVDYRESLGFEVIALTGGQPPFPRLRQVLADGGVVALLGERDLKRSGVSVDFFGEPTTMPAGPARLAQETGAALHAVHCWFENSPRPGWGFSISEELQVDALQPTVQRIADSFASSIAEHPTDWHMLQPQWTADLDPVRLARRPLDEDSS